MGGSGAWFQVQKGTTALNGKGAFGTVSAMAGILPVTSLIRAALQRYDGGSVDGRVSGRVGRQITCSLVPAKFEEGLF
jgi:hypothetical protein